MPCFRRLQAERARRASRPGIFEELDAADGKPALLTLLVSWIGRALAAAVRAGGAVGRSVAATVSSAVQTTALPATARALSAAGQAISTTTVSAAECA